MFQIIIETSPNIEDFVYQSNLFREIGFSEEEINNAIVYGYRISTSFQQSSISEEEIVEQIEIAGQIGISAERALQLIEEGYRFSYVGLATVIKDK